MAKLVRLSEDDELSYRGDPEFLDWFGAPCAINRDSGHLAKSNHDAIAAMFKEADPDANDHRLIRLGHWACGWVAGFIVRPGSKCQEIAEEVKDQLDDYPVLDETDYSQREFDDYCERWEDYGCDEFKDHVRKALPLLTEDERAAFDDLSAVVLRKWYEDNAPGLYEHDGDDIMIPRAWFDFVNYDNLRAFLARQVPDNPAQQTLPLMD